MHWTKINSMGKTHRRTVTALAILLACCPGVSALDPSLDISQYAHTAWTFRDGFSVGNIFAIAQTSDGYFWLGGEYGLFRFDGVRAVPWQPPAGQHLPDKFVFKLLAARDGTLWISTFEGLVTWDGARLIRHPEFDRRKVQSLLEDHEGTVWAGTWSSESRFARLCAMRSVSSQCFGDDGVLGKFVTALYEDPSGALWVSAESGFWRWRPGPPRRESTESRDISALTDSEDGRALIAVYGAGLLQLEGDKLQAYSIPGADSNRPLRDREVNANKLLRDRNGGLWIGTVEHGLIHVCNGRTDTFTKSDGLSGDVVLSLFEDREGNVWVSTTGGLDRFSEYAVATLSVKQGLASDAVASVLADRDGGVWIGTHEGLTRWKNGQTASFRKVNGLPDDRVESLFQDDRGRLWVFAGHELAYFDGNRFIALRIAIPSEDVYSITGNEAGDLWLAGDTGLSRLHDGRLVEQLPWPALGHYERAKDVVADHGGVWLSFWKDGGVLYFKDGRQQASYTAGDGLGKGRIAGLTLDRDGALWAATDEGGLSRIKDGHITTLTSRNGLPCDMIHWSIEDSDRSLWIYTACGLVRIAHTELEAWIADPHHRVATSVLDAADGVRLRAVSASSYSPTVARSTDGKLWFVTGEGVQIVNPRYLTYNALPPPVHIEQITADGKTYDASNGLRLPPGVRDLAIDYTALSLVAPEKVRFRYKLEGQDKDWREVVNDRRVQYSNLPPKHYRFRVIAANNSGVWNEQGAALDFAIAPAYWQTNWFRALCVLTFAAMLWTVYQLRVRALERRQAALERHQGEIRALNEQLIKAQEAERIRIAGELHDGVLQQITSLTLRLGTVKYQVPADSEAKASIVGLQQELIGIGTDVRHLSHELHPALLQESGLPAALSSYCEEFSKVRGLPVSCETDESVKELSPGAALCIYRIAQEALGNAAKYSAAKKVEVRLTRSDGRVWLSVSDDGVGCAPSQIGRSGGLGLINMRERVLQLNGTFEFDSEPGRGSRVRVTIPFRPATS